MRDLICEVNFFARIAKLR